MNNKTTVGGIIAVLTAVPQMIQTLGLAEVPNWLRVTGLVCTAISFLYVTYQSQDRKD
jgi:hypothetical protein